MALRYAPTMNPLIPGPIDIALSIAVIVNLVLVVAALVSLARSRGYRGKLLAVLLIVLLPLVGPVVSLLSTRAWRASVYASTSDPLPTA
jgi:hypothetical protein